MLENHELEGLVVRVDVKTGGEEVVTALLHGRVIRALHLQRLLTDKTGSSSGIYGNAKLLTSCTVPVFKCCGTVTIF